MRLYIGLLHYPVYNKNYQRIASAITNFDLHDLSRLAKTYSVKSFFVITPLEDQQRLAERILRHWSIGYGASYNSYRKEAVELITIVSSLDESLKKITKIEDENPLLIATDASKQDEKSITYSNAAKIINTEKTVMIIFGTAWGLDKEIIDKADYILEPIEGRNNYNHLSVRAAAAIILDRLVWRYPEQ